MSEEAVRVFVGDAEGPEDHVGFFEDDGETGYLYVSDRRTNKIIRHLEIYDNAKNLDITEEDVTVVWSSDGRKCGVIIWGGMRGVIDLAKNREGRAKLQDRRTPPISDPEWLRGFERYFE
jgi:hypothetical protein